MSTFEFDFLAIPLLVWALAIFSETTGSDLSNGVGLVSVYASLKKLQVLQAHPYEHPNLGNHENLEFWPAVGLQRAHFSPISCADAQFSTLSDS